MTIITATSTQIDGWLHTPGFYLGASQFTYSITTAASTWPGYAGGSEPFKVGYAAANAALSTGFQAAIAIWDGIIAPDFTQVADNASSRGEVRVAYTTISPGTLGYAYSGTPVAPGGVVGDVWINSTLQGESWASGTTDFAGLLHEIGHALGLKHTFESPVVPTAYDDTRYSIMSYTDPGVFWTFQQSGMSISATGSQPAAITPMVLDIAAAQAIYGAETSTRTGNDTYTFTQWAAVLQTLYDAGGSDTLDASNFTLPSVIDLRPGAYSSIGQADAAAQIAHWSALYPVFASFIASTINGEANRYTFTDNVGIAVGTVIENAKGGSGADTITGNDVGNVLTGGQGNDTIDGGSNVDTAAVSGNRAAYTVNQPSTGTFTVTGPDGTDTLSNVEYLQFADQTLRLRPGSGTEVDFSASPSTYMAAIRDFDGNNLGGASGWLHIGATDVNGDGDVDHILVNRTIGRFAEVATAPDGLVYFNDYNWAGETRVVGIYIDPLVQSGEVVAGSDHDSQRRFQNDLFIENINRVLGSGDYDHDGLQEVYFGLTDGTAYLHAYMHADGNIRYANYQNQQQVIDYLSGHSWAASTYDGWFN